MRGREAIVPQRRRRIPPQFSWVDHRLIRDGHLQGRSAEALALYLLLVTVSDADGLSWYGASALCRMLSWTPEQLRHVRDELGEAGLLAYRKPLYQVLDLAPPLVPMRLERGRRAQAVAIGEILKGLAAPDAQ
jgi:hypothetical protein